MMGLLWAPGYWYYLIKSALSHSIISVSISRSFSLPLSLLLSHSLCPTQCVTPFCLLLSFFPSLFFLSSLSLSFPFFSLTPSHRLGPTHFIFLSLSFPHPLTHSMRLTSSLPLQSSRTVHAQHHHTEQQRTWANLRRIFGENR